MDGGEIGERQGLVARLAGAAEQGGGALEEGHGLVEAPLVAAQPGEPAAVLGVLGRIDALLEVGDRAHESVLRRLQTPQAGGTPRRPRTRRRWRAPPPRPCAGPFPASLSAMAAASRPIDSASAASSTCQLRSSSLQATKNVRKPRVRVEARVPLLARQREELGDQGLGLPPLLLHLSGGAARPLGHPGEGALVDRGLRLRRAGLAGAPAHRTRRQHAPALPGTARTLQQMQHEPCIGDGQGLQENAQNRRFWMVHQRGPPSPPSAGSGLPA